MQHRVPHILAHLLQHTLFGQIAQRQQPPDQLIANLDRHGLPKQGTTQRFNDALARRLIGLPAQLPQLSRACARGSLVLRSCSSRR